MSLGQRIVLLETIRQEEIAAGRFDPTDPCCERLQLFHNPFAELPLPMRFAGPFDDQWTDDGELSAYGETAWGLLGDHVPGRKAIKGPGSAEES